jgi:hypothetical protein
MLPTVAAAVFEAMVSRCMARAGVRTKARVAEPLLDGGEAAGSVTVVLNVVPVRKVVILADVDGVAVVLAVARVIAHRLEVVADLSASVYHD